MRDQVILTDCLHTIVAEGGALKVGDTIGCITCRINAEVIQVSEPFWEYIAECLECHYTRHTGHSASLAGIYSSRHRGNTGHRIRLMKVDEKGRRLNHDGSLKEVPPEG